MTFGTFATACWQGITCSKSLPNEEQQQQQQQQGDNGGSGIADNESSNAGHNSGGNNGDNSGGNNGDNSGSDNGNIGDNSGNGDSGGDDSDEDDDGQNNGTDNLIWSNDLERHSCGDFSHAVIQGNDKMRNFSQVDVGSNAIFVGIYDGHVGPRASNYIRMNLMTKLVASIKEHQTLTEEVLQNVIFDIDDGFLKIVERSERSERLDPILVITGSCCLVGVIWKGTLFIAHVGVSRVVNGVIQESDNRILAQQMTVDHNVNTPCVRQHVINSIRNDPDLVVRCDDGMWRVKKIVMIARSIGDGYLKRSEFIVPQADRYREFQLPGGYLIEPALTAEADLSSRAINDTDRFFIFGSYGFWLNITNNRAARIVHSNPRQGIARRLLKSALKEAARKAQIAYSDIHRVPLGQERRTIHDDMSVIVLFVDHDLVGVKDSNLEQRSFEGFTHVAAGPSKFKEIDDLM